MYIRQLFHRQFHCLTLLILEPEYSGQTIPIPWWLMPWHLALAGYNPPQYWLHSEMIEVNISFYIFEKNPPIKGWYKARMIKQLWYSHALRTLIRAYINNYISAFLFSVISHVKLIKPQLRLGHVSVINTPPFNDDVIALPSSNHKYNLSLIVKQASAGYMENQHFSWHPVHFCAFSWSPLNTE